MILTKLPETAAGYIASGRVVAFPTGTSYGLAADALQGHALQRLRNLKQRDSVKTFTVCMSEALWHQFLKLTDVEERLLHRLANQPLTLLVTPQASLQHLAQDGRIGLRVVDHPLMAVFCEAAGVPLTATSANVADQEPCYSPADIEQQFPAIMRPEQIVGVRPGITSEELGRTGPTTYDLSLACILDGGLLPNRQPTTIASIENGRAVIVRPGALLEDELDQLLQA